MDFNSKREKLCEKFKHLFYGCHFKFEGLDPEIRKGYEEVVVNLGAVISNDAEYIFVEESFFNKRENRTRNNLYNISYIRESVVAGKPLNVHLYRLSSVGASKPDTQRLFVPKKKIVKTFIDIDHN